MESRSISRRKHFVLVHGLCHGAWCWYKLIPLLRKFGHKVTALDLGGCGIHPKNVEEISSFFDYTKPLLDFMDSLPQEERVVLVSHSFSGLCISLAMQNFPQKISVAVFISAYMPKFNDPPANLILEFFKRSEAKSFMDCKFTFNGGVGNLPKSVTLGPDYIASIMYQQCQIEDIELAKMLMRPSGLFVEEMSKEFLLSEEKYGSVRRVYVVCEGDQVMEEEFQSFLINNSPPQQVKSIKEAGHMVMLSKAQEICVCLQEIAEDYR
ncbi:hypothetical protein M9H77_09169 [Catharanthus roseus]|uniref:Uncharacterized protein n=1 Tax=Catharanthus roseus TaxID=4058 RepID=A0ACC0C021_CATRO|nr:hypothetical protein M9H77_09169 [Catharanthus roseus]